MNNKCPKELYAKTMADMELFKANGYEVKYVWESNFKAWAKKVRNGDQAEPIPLEHL